ncbi:ABC transporter permease [Paenibacillus xanthanilyticus]|uniref:ABC transporter permease n=1 Tax=Paenibacillus xanthanilyticus TaxID=1783531 RepID=A0ABV8K604_9BACL
MHRSEWRRELRKHLNIYGLFIKNGLIAQLEFRANFVTGIVVECGYLLAKLLYVLVVYRTGVTINGLKPDSILMFVGTYTMMTGLFVGLFMTNFMNLSQHIRTGSLDILMTKPVSLQFITTLRHVDIGMPLPNLLGGAVMVGIGWHRMGIPFDIGSLASFAGYMVGAVALTYALFLLPELLAFKFVSTRALTEISHALWDFNNMPMGIYHTWVRRIGVFVLPIFLITNFSPLFVLGQLKPAYIAWGIAAPILFLALNRFLWTRAVKQYASASS